MSQESRKGIARLPTWRRRYKAPADGAAGLMGYGRGAPPCQGRCLARHPGSVCGDIMPRTGFRCRSRLRRPVPDRGFQRPSWLPGWFRRAGSRRGSAPPDHPARMLGILDRSPLASGAVPIPNPRSALRAQMRVSAPFCPWRTAPSGGLQRPFGLCWVAWRGKAPPIPQRKMLGSQEGLWKPIPGAGQGGRRETPMAASFGVQTARAGKPVSARRASRAPRSCA